MRFGIGAVCLLAFGSACLFSGLMTAWSEDQSTRVTAPDRTLEGSELHRQLQGKWFLQKREVNGRRMNDPEGAYLHVTKDRMMKFYSPSRSRFGIGDDLVGNEFYRITPGKDLISMDMTGKPAWSEFTEGIYRIENDTLTLCLAAKGHSRPTRLTTGSGEGDGEVLFVYRKSAKGR